LGAGSADGTGLDRGLLLGSVVGVGRLLRGGRGVGPAVRRLLRRVLRGRRRVIGRRFLRRRFGRDHAGCRAHHRARLAHERLRGVGREHRDAEAVLGVGGEADELGRDTIGRDTLGHRGELPLIGAAEHVQRDGVAAGGREHVDAVAAERRGIGILRLPLETHRGAPRDLDDEVARGPGRGGRGRCAEHGERGDREGGHHRRHAA
jgi:hypothetical protein